MFNIHKTRLDCITEELAAHARVAMEDIELEMNSIFITSNIGLNNILTSLRQDPDGSAVAIQVKKESIDTPDISIRIVYIDNVPEDIIKYIGIGWGDECDNIIGPFLLSEIVDCRLDIFYIIELLTFMITEISNSTIED